MAGLAVGIIMAAIVATLVVVALYNRVAAAANDLPLIYVNVPSRRYWVLPASDWESFVPALVAQANGSGNDVLCVHSTDARKFVENYIEGEKGNSPVAMCYEVFQMCPICEGQAPQEEAGLVGADADGVECGAMSGRLS
jgi:hypothetical protein